MTPAQERGCYGCLIKDFRESIERSTTFEFDGPGMVAMSLLSDAQQEMNMGLQEEARQTINRVKWMISEYELGFTADYKARKRYF